MVHIGSLGSFSARAMAVVRQWGLEVHHITAFDAQFVPPVVSQIEQLPSPAQPIDGQ